MRPKQPDVPLVHAAANLRHAVERWRRQLTGERRMAAKTVEAYSRDAIVAQYEALCHALVASHESRKSRVADRLTNQNVTHDSRLVSQDF